MSESLEIYTNWTTLLDGHTGKRFATIYKENDGHKNIYTILLEIRYMTPEEVKEITFYTKKKALEIANSFLDPDRDVFYWSESIEHFLKNYFK